MVMNWKRIAGAALIAAACAGCRPQAPSSETPLPGGPDASATTDDGLPSDEKLLAQLDSVLDFTYDKRRLQLKDQAAWQIIHGSMAFGRQYPVIDGDHEVSAVDHVLAGGKMTGWNLVEGDVLDEATGRRGVRSILEPGTKSGQGHEDQWLGYLTYCNLPLSEPIVVEGKPHTVEDLVLQAEKDVHRNGPQEYSWTLMGITAYRPSDYKWIAGDGKQWSIAKLVEIELGHDLATSACGGTHRLVGLTLARNRHFEAGGKPEGVWKECDDKINACVAKARELQNPDGSLSSNYLQRPGKSADLAAGMGSAGHVLEFVAIALPKEELNQPWVKRAAADMVSVFKKTKPIDMECGALFHAAHGLVVYREKLYGPRTFPGTPKIDAGPEKTAAVSK